MTPAGAIDIIMRDYDKVDPADSNNSALRTQYLGFLQDVYDYAFDFRDFEWTFDETNVTLSSGQNSVALGTTFAGFGTHGGLWDSSRRVRLTERSKSYIKALREEGPLTDSLEFAIFDSKFQFPFTASSNITYRAFHRVRAETLVDNTTEMVLPDRWCRRIVLAGLRVRSQLAKSDARQDWKGLLKDGMGQLCRDENPLRSGVQKMPMGVSAGW